MFGNTPQLTISVVVVAEVEDDVVRVDCAVVVVVVVANDHGQLVVEGEVSVDTAQLSVVTTS